jgi:hypothetical protein
VSDVVWRLFKYTRIIEEEEEEARQTIEEEDKEETRFNAERDIFLMPPQSPTSLTSSSSLLGFPKLEDSNGLHWIYRPETVGRSCTSTAILSTTS